MRSPSSVGFSLRGLEFANGKCAQAEQAAEKVDSERVLVAQALLPVLNLQHLHSAHSQEWLCYWTFSAACEAYATKDICNIRERELKIEIA
jgi:hypothetical protein